MTDSIRYKQLIKRLDVLDEKQNEIDCERLEILEELDKMEPNSNWKEALDALGKEMGID